MENQDIIKNLEKLIESINTTNKDEQNKKNLRNKYLEHKLYHSQENENLFDYEFYSNQKKKRLFVKFENRKSSILIKDYIVISKTYNFLNNENDFLFGEIKDIKPESCIVLFDGEECKEIDNMLITKLIYFPYINIIDKDMK